LTRAGHRNEWLSRRPRSKTEFPKEPPIDETAAKTATRIQRRFDWSPQMGH
jgi:hypothetical protein